MAYGLDIGRKFYEDGTVRRYPGNTVVADVTPGCTGYDVMNKLRDMIIENGFEKTVILLPSDSYHMTVISGVNDQVRDAEHWPPNMPLDTPMAEMDDYISEAVAKVPMPKNIRVKFNRVIFGSHCMIIAVDPVNEAELREFRDAVAKEIGFKLPRHDNYTFHISLGYTWVMPEGEELERFNALKQKMNEFLAKQPEFGINPPYMAFYNDMYAFSPERLPRD
jgi:hypothetical protein